MRIQRKYHPITFILCLIFFGGFLFLLPACTPSWVTNITQLSDVIWYSESPKIEILILNENRERGFGYICSDNLKTQVYFLWRFSLFDFTLASEYELSKSENPRLCITGHYKSLNDTVANLNISNDSLFNGKYTNQTFVMRSRQVNRDELDIKYYTNVQWTATAPTLTFHILPEERRRGVGEIEYGNITQDMIFYWENDSRFSVYELQSDLQSESPILSGTYTSSNLKATLTIEDDLIFNHKFKTIELVAKGLNDP